jgi:hypothetical protein
MITPYVIFPREGLAMIRSRFSILAMLLVFSAAAAENAKVDWDALLKQYKDFGLPFPPDDAPLVYVDRHLRCPGFALKLNVEGARADVLSGTQHGYRQTILIVPPEDVEAPETFARICMDWSTPLGAINVALPAAIQCRARGWNTLAERLLEKGLSETVGRSRGAFARPGKLPPNEALSHIAYAHYAEKLFEPQSDWPALHKRLTEVIAASPCLQNERKTWLTDALALSLKPSGAVPGTTEALIDGLIQDDSLTRPFGRNYGRNYPPFYAKILAQGFDAIPVLVKHLDDERLTRTIRVGFNNFPAWPVRVGDVVSDISGGDLRLGRLRRQQGYRLEKDAVLKWYANVRNNEESHLITKALNVDNDQHSPHFGSVEILAKKYPHALVDVYLKLLKEHARLQSDGVLDALAKTNLPEKEKLRLYLLGAGHADLDHRRAAFWKLKDADHEQFVTLLVETLNGLPETPLEPYWKCPEASFTSLVLQTADKRAWNALLAAARRADVGLRFQMLSLHRPAKPTAAVQRQALIYLSQFLADETVRDVKSSPALYDGPNAAMEFPVLSVQNHAADVLAGFLELPRAKNDFSEENWARLRKTVREKLEKEALPKEFE